jgi:hypothetical protein
MIRRDYGEGRIHKHGVPHDVHVANEYPFGIGWNLIQRDEHRAAAFRARAGTTPTSGVSS